MTEDELAHQWRQAQLWHLDCTDPRFIHCCREATRAAHDWLTQSGSFTPEEGARLHGFKIRQLLGVRA